MNFNRGLHDLYEHVVKFLKCNFLKSFKKNKKYR